MEVTWAPGKHHIRQRSTVCSGNDKRAKQLVGNPDETLNSLLLSNGWVDRKDKPRVGAVSEGLH